MPTTINTPRDTTIQATNTALGLLGKDASLQDIKTALLQIVAALTPSIDNDYEELINKPSINSVSLVGNKTSKQLGIRQIIPMKSEEYAQLSSAEKMDDDVDYLITDRNTVSVPIDDDNVSVNKVWSSDKVDSTKVDKENVLNTVEECSASTDLEDVAGASAVSALNSSLTWEQIAKNVTSLSHDLSQYKEILIDVGFQGNVNHNTTHIITAELSATTHYYSSGYYRTTNDSIGVKVGVNTSGVTGSLVYVDGNTTAISSTFSVYAR